VNRISLRYAVGYGLVVLSRLLRKVFDQIRRVVALPEQCALIIWTPSESARSSRAVWDSASYVRGYARMEHWLDAREHDLVERYFAKNAAVLNVACGAGREVLLLARRGMSVTACDWSPRMVAEARRRAQEANVRARFAVVDLMQDLPYAEQAFDYVFLSGYGYLFPRPRRIGFLRQAYSVLKVGGVFIVGFPPAKEDPRIPAGPSERLFMRLRRWAPFNREYEPGDRLVAGTFAHFFRSEELVEEFQEARFLIKERLWDEGYAVLAKV
jgi:SAM-dependent methyltransferase